MASEVTGVDALADSLPSIIASARIVREQEGVMPSLVDKVTLAKNTGLNWNEISMEALTAQGITETTRLNNPQQMVDTLFTVVPTSTGIHTIITDKVRERISKNAFGKVGSLAQNAIQRKKDQDGLTVLDGATTSLGGAGTTLTTGIIAAAQSRISSDATENGNPPYRCVLQGFQIKDIYDELTASIGTYEVTSGETGRVFREGFRGQISSARVYEGGNIDVDDNGDAKGGVFAKEAIVLVQGRAPRTETRREPDLGGGADSMWLYDEYAYGERSAGNWLYEIFTDATVPTS
jgi:hypothetical protein